MRRSILAGVPTQRTLRGVCVLALSAFLALPGLLAAQGTPTIPLRYGVTPFGGFRVGYNVQAGRQTVFANDSTATFFSENEVSGGSAAGVEGIVRIWGPWSALVTGMFSTSGNITTEATTEEGTTTFQTAGSRFYMVKAGAAYEFAPGRAEDRYHQPTARIFVAPALVREDPADDISAPGNPLNAPVNHWALNFGFSAETPLWQPRPEAPIWMPYVLFHLSVEDYATLWNERELGRRVDQFFAQDQGAVTTTVVDIDRANLLVLRAGISLQF